MLMKKKTRTEPWDIEVRSGLGSTFAGATLMDGVRHCESEGERLTGGGL